MMGLTFAKRLKSLTTCMHVHQPLLEQGASARVRQISNAIPAMSASAALMMASFGFIGYLCR